MGLGDSLKKWAQSKATEMLTADSDKRDERGRRGGLGRAAGQERRRRAADAHGVPEGRRVGRQAGGRPARTGAGAEQERDEIASLPLATVQLSVAGHATGQWSGQLHLAWKEFPPRRQTPSTPSDPYSASPACPCCSPRTPRAPTRRWR